MYAEISNLGDMPWFWLKHREGLYTEEVILLDVQFVNDFPGTTTEVARAREKGL